MSKLTPKFVKEATSAGTFQDGRGLFLKITAGGTKNWVFRYSFQGTRRDMGLGAYPVVSLRDARLEADKARLGLAQGIDPLAKRHQLKLDARAKRRKGAIFRAEAEQFIRTHAPSWSPRHAIQWRNSLDTHVYPRIGGLPVEQIDTDQVLEVLAPIWSTVPITATRVRNRIELILDAAKARQLRTGENPARWRGHLDKLLPRQKRTATPFPAMPAEDVPALLHRLDGVPGPAARACELLILTATRSNEVCGARWEEFDLEARIWMIPAHRMKTRRGHRVPLTEAMLEVLKQVRGIHREFVFLNSRRTGPLPSNALRRVLNAVGADDCVPHGFRSTFRTWAAEQTNYSREVCEMALAHSLESKVEAAYNRGDLLEKRRALMEDWSTFLSTFEREVVFKALRRPMATGEAAPRGTVLENGSKSTLSVR